MKTRTLVALLIIVTVTIAAYSFWKFSPTHTGQATDMSPDTGRKPTIVQFSNFGKPGASNHDKEVKSKADRTYAKVIPNLFRNPIARRLWKKILKQVQDDRFKPFSLKIA